MGTFSHTLDILQVAIAVAGIRPRALNVRCHDFFYLLGLLVYEHRHSDTRFISKLRLR